MSQQDETTGGQGQRGAGEAEHPEQDEPSASDAKGPLTGMMERCGCGAGMMSKMAGMMGKCFPSAPTEPETEPKKQD